MRRVLTTMEIDLILNKLKDFEVTEEINIVAYESTALDLWESLTQEQKGSQMGIDIFTRIDYFMRCKNPCYTGLNQCLRTYDRANEMCKFMCD